MEPNIRDFIEENPSPVDLKYILKYIKETSRENIEKMEEVLLRIKKEAPEKITSNGYLVLGLCINRQIMGSPISSNNFYGHSNQNYYNKNYKTTIYDKIQVGYYLKSLELDSNNWYGPKANYEHRYATHYQDGSIKTGAGNYFTGYN
jgi:hypothetical protein